MDDKEKFLSEWRSNFPAEEPPDISFFNSINFLNIRSKITQCEGRISDLKLEIQKEEFILNWLITVDIEISVLGNVGMSVNTEEGERPNYGLEQNHFQEYPVEKQDNVSLDAGSIKDEFPRDETSRETQHETHKTKVEEEETLTRKSEEKTREGPSCRESRSDLFDVAQPQEPNCSSAGLDISRKDDHLGSCVVDGSEHSEHPEYENVFDLIKTGEENKQSIMGEDIDPNCKSRDKRRAGGSWSVYIEDEEEDKDNHCQLQELTKKNEVNIEASNKTDSSNGNFGGYVKEYKKDSPIYEEVRFFTEENIEDSKPKSDNVTVNLLYQATDIKPNPENNTNELEEEESIYENIRDMNLIAKHALIPSGVRIDANDSASDYDSDGGKSENKDNCSKEVQCFRHMTVDEIDHLRKWRSDEDLSQITHDLDEKSCDSDDSLDPATNSKLFTHVGKIGNDDNKTTLELKAENRKTEDSDSLKSQEGVNTESSEEMEEDGGDQKSSQKMRKYLVKNLLESEKCYYDCLDMVRKYMKPLEKSTETSQPILTKAEFDKIFLGIDALYTLHKDLLQQLKERILGWNENQVIGDLLKILMDGFSVYKSYINNYKSSQETLLKCRNANAIFDNILQKDIRISSLKDPIKLDALLYKPVDRMTQYSLILNDLLKNTAEDHADNELLSDATANLFDLFEQVNVNRRDKKAPQRQLLKEGAVVELVDGERKARTLILMNDVVICAKLKTSRDAYVCKWYSSFVDIKLKPFKASEASQTVPVTTKSECDKLRATIANIRSEMRRDSQILTSSVSVDGGSPFVRPKLRKRDSTTPQVGSRASTRGMEKLKKKLQEQERLLQLIAPSVPLTLYHKNGKTYTLLLSNEDDKILWKEGINQRIKRMVSRKQESVHLSSVEIQQALEISFKVQRLGMRFGAIIPSPFLSSETADAKISDEEGLTGYLYVHIQSGKSFSKTAEFYCVLEVDSYGYFFRKAKTKPAKGSEPQWDEDFEFDVEAASSMRLVCYNCRSRLIGDEFSGKVVIDLTKENLTDNMSHTFTVILDKQGAVTLTISYSPTLQGIERTRTNAAYCTNVFKVPISSVTRREKFDIPLIVISCIKEIEKRGLEEVGIYRVSGVASEIKSLKSAFDENPQSAVFALSEADIHAVAGLIKLFFRELPEPLFTNSRYPRFVSGLQISDQEEKELYMTDLLQQLPKANKLTALYLLEHLRRVSQIEKVNKMGINNLSTVFGPTVLRPSVVDNESKADKLRSGSTFDIGALDVMSQVSIFRYFLGLNSIKARLPVDDLELWQRLDHQKAAEIQERLMETAVEYLI